MDMDFGGLLTQNNKQTLKGYGISTTVRTTSKFKNEPNTKYLFDCKNLMNHIQSI